MKKIALIISLILIIVSTKSQNITSIAEIQGDQSYNGEEVTIEGVIMIGAGVLKDQHLEAYIQDTSGKGLRIYNQQLLQNHLDNIVRGNQLKMHGTIYEYQNSITEIIDFTYEVTGEGFSVDSFLVVMDISEALNWQENEGTFIRTTGIISDPWGNYGFKLNNNNYVIDTWIWPTTGIPPSLFTEGENVSLKCALTVYNGASSLNPGYLEDIEINPNANDEYTFINNEITISPNPFSERTIISFDNPSHKEYTLSIYDINGNKVRKGNIARSSTFKLEKGDMLNGVYILELNGEKNYREKFIVR